MTNMKVFVTRQIPDEGIKILKQKKYQLDIFNKDKIIPRQDLLRGVKGADALLCLLTDKIDEGVFQAAGKKLKIVANYAVGFDNIDLAAAKKRKIFVTNTPCEEISESVAEHAFALMIALARRLPEADRFTKQEKYQGWSPTLFLGTDLYHKTLGIVGLGHIGFALAQRAVKGFNMKIIYSDPKRNIEFERKFSAKGGSASGGEKKIGAKYADLPTLLEKSDFVSLHVPLNSQTRHLISTAEFACMKKTAFLINTARGPVVDEKALLRALETKRIAGAGLDVFEAEPAIDCDIRDDLELKNYDNVILTPHIASATVETRQIMSQIAAKNIIAALENKTPPNLVK